MPGEKTDAQPVPTHRSLPTEWIEGPPRDDHGQPVPRDAWWRRPASPVEVWAATIGAVAILGYLVGQAT